MQRVQCSAGEQRVMRSEAIWWAGKERTKNTRSMRCPVEEAGRRVGGHASVDDGATLLSLVGELELKLAISKTAGELAASSHSHRC